MYWGDYARDTGHLNAAGHGAYLMLIKHYWCTGLPLRDDDNELWRIACCDSKKEWLGLRPKIVRLFVVELGLLRHKRIEKEIANTTAIASAKSEAGKKGAKNRWHKNGSANGSAMALPLTEDAIVITEPNIRHPFANAQSPSPSPKEEKKGSELRSDAGASGLSVEPRPIRDALWEDGPAILQKMIGKSDGQSRAFLGLLVKKSRDDCAKVYAALREAESLRPVDPAAWLTQACTPASERVIEVEQPRMTGTW